MAKGLIAAKVEVQNSYSDYFRDRDLALTQHEAMGNINFFASLQAPDPYVFEPNLSVASLRAKAVGGLLHLSSCCVQPPSFEEWDEISENRDPINRFRLELKQYKPDQTLVLEQKITTLKNWAALVRGKIISTKESPAKQDLHQIKMLAIDLEKLNCSIFEAESGGRVWSVENFGCTRDEVDSWRSDTS